MTGIIVVKMLMVSILWTAGWIVRFVHTDAAPNLKNHCIAFAPLILLFLYFLFFWWG